MSTFKFSTVFAVGLVFAGAAFPAFGQSVELLGEHSAWSSYTTEDGAGQICFVMSEPTTTAPQPAELGAAHLYVTHRVAENLRSEVNLISGYPFAAESQATATIGDQSFAMVTAGDSAWLADPAQNANMVGVMRAGATMTITGTAEAGGQVTQAFSLAGVTAATNQIDASCPAS